MIAEAKRKDVAELQDQRQGPEQAATIARSEMRVARTIEAIHGLGYKSVAEALAEYDNAVVAHAALLTASQGARSEVRDLEQHTEPTDNAVPQDDVAPQRPSHAAQEPLERGDDDQAWLRPVSAGSASPQRKASGAPRPLFSRMTAADSPTLLAASATTPRRSAQPRLKQTSLTVLWVSVVGVAALLAGLILLARPPPPAFDSSPPAAPWSSELVKTAKANRAARERAQPAPAAPPAATDPGSDSSQPEQPAVPTTPDPPPAAKP